MRLKKKKRFKTLLGDLTCIKLYNGLQCFALTYNIFINTAATHLRNGSFILQIFGANWLLHTDTKILICIETQVHTHTSCCVENLMVALELSETLIT